jgi:predicted RNase H-like HicB family nuclease
VKDYHINVFWSDDDDCYVADIPDLKFCSAFGDTPERAVAEVMIARSLWLESARESGQQVPEPRYRPAIYSALA